MNDSARYLLVHSTDLDVLVPSAEETIVKTPYDELRKALLAQSLVIEKALLDTDGKLTEAANIIRETKATMKTTHCRSLVEWASAMKNAKSLGHELFACDDPRARSLGFVNHTTNEAFFLGLTRLKEATAEDWAESGLSRSEFFVGRACLIGDNPIFDYKWDTPAISEQEIAYLNGLVQEMCADIDKEFAKEVPVLDLFMPRPAPKEPTRQTYS